MRRNIGLVLVVVGAFLLALALLTRFYIQGQVIAAPKNVYQKTTLQADNATYLDLAKLQLRQGATVTAVNTTRGDVKASGGKIAVWDSFTSVEDPGNNAKIEVQQQRAAFDRRDGELGNTRGASVGNDTSVRQSGIGLFWPIGTKKKTYQYFDLTTKRTWPMIYQGEDKIHGVKAYRFVQNIPATVTESVKGGAPATLLGLKNPPPAGLPGYDKKTGSVAVDRVYSATVTAWVDPRTGAQISQEQKVKTVLRTGDGVDRLVVGDLDLKMVDASQKHLAEYSDSQAAKLAIAQTYVPYLGGGLGIVLLVVGLVLALPGRQTIIPEARTKTDGPRPGGQESSDREPSA